MWSQMYICLHRKYPLFLSNFNETLGFSTDFSKKYSNIKFHENPSSGSCVVACELTDMKKLTVDFLNVANASKRDDCIVGEMCLMSSPFLNSSSALLTLVTCKLFWVDMKFLAPEVTILFCYSWVCVLMVSGLILPLFCFTASKYLQDVSSCPPCNRQVMF
jgi:hypothetical protein